MKVTGIQTCALTTDVVKYENFKINVKNKQDFYIDKYNWENVISKIVKITD